MNTRWVMNSAVMPAGRYGSYFYRPLSVRLAQEWFNAGPFESRVGYASTATYLSRKFGVVVDVSRELTDFEPGDEALVCRLRYRVANPSAKAFQDPPEDAWELGWLAYLADIPSLAHRAGINLEDADIEAREAGLPVATWLFLRVAGNDDLHRHLLGVNL